MKLTFTLLIVLSSFIILAQGDGFSDQFITTGLGTTWKDPASWAPQFATDDPAFGTGDGIPDGDDEVIIAHDLNVDSNAQFGTLQIFNDAASADGAVQLFLFSGDTLTGQAGGGFTGDAFCVGSTNGSPRSGFMRIEGVFICSSYTITAAGTNGRGITQVRSGGVLDIEGDLTFSASISSRAQLTGQVGTGNRINVGGAISGTGRYFGGTGDQCVTNFNGTSAQVINTDSPLDITYSNITITNSAGVSLESDLVDANFNGVFKVGVGGVFNLGTDSISTNDSVVVEGTFNSNGFLDIDGPFVNTGTYTSAGGNINLTGDWSNDGTYTPLAGDTVTLDGGALQNFAGITTFSNLTISNTLGGAKDVDFVSGTVNVTQVLDINDCNVANTGASVVLLSDANGTAQMADIGTGNYTGNLTAQRRLDCATEGWRELTSPVIGTVLDDWESSGLFMSGFPGTDFESFTFVSVYTYDETLAAGVKNNGWIEGSNAATNTTGPTSGNRIYLDDAVSNIAVTGTPYTGTQSLAFTRTGIDNTNDGWNFIGNPYPCSVDWDLLDAADKTGLDEIYYIWNETQGAYASHETSGTDLNGGANLIASHQGFWVHASASGNLVWNESDKDVTDRTFIRNAHAASGKDLKVKITNANNSFSDEVALRIRTAGTNDYDEGLDYFKLYSLIPDEVAQLAFVSNDGKELSISSIPPSTRSVALKAFAGASALGMYTIEFENVLEFAPNACIRLEDLATGTFQDLRANPTYTYSTLALDEDSPRFMIHINVEYEATSVDASCALVADGMIDVTHSVLPSFDLSWSDANGTAIGSATSASSNYTITGLIAGDYHVAVTGSCATLEGPSSIISPPAVLADFSCCVSAEVGELISISNTSTGGVNFSWDMGDGTIYSDVDVIHTYGAPGVYTITLTADNNNLGACSDVKTYDVEITSSAAGVDNAAKGLITAYASEGRLTLLNESGVHISRVQLIDINGKLVLDQGVNTLSNAIVETPKQAQGIFILKVTTNAGDRKSVV